LFHTGPTFGVSPFRVLRHSQSSKLSRASRPSCGFQVPSLTTPANLLPQAPSLLPLTDWPFRRGLFHNLPHFKALFPASGCSFRSTCSLGRKASTLLGFFLPRVFSFRSGFFPRNPHLS
jgi:hypothetical protein